jgi:mRNA interferase MazF
LLSVGIRQNFSKSFSAVYIGEIPGLNDKESVAIINQMRPISKLRVFKPKLAKEQAYRLTYDQMDLIDKKIKAMYTKAESNTQK